MTEVLLSLHCISLYSTFVTNEYTAECRHGLNIGSPVVKLFIRTFHVIQLAGK